MRISELNLLAYGKFTNQKLALLKADYDFHVIIGPNEAGKSTVRRAITELMFGMERQSPLGFKHPQSDLRVGGVLEAPPLALSFIRTKRQRSLRSLQDEELADSYLSPVLGALTQEAFENLHCLDHERLVRGGQDIVDPRNSVSQILFQAASGFEGFVEIREALNERASKLFAVRGHNNEYAQAAARYTAAQRTLKDVQIRAKEWAHAQDSFVSASERLEEEKKARRALEIQRHSWERARRLAPRIESLARLQRDLEALGKTIVFPPSARETLDSGIAAMNKASGIVKAREHDVLERQQALNEIVVDEKVLGLATDIERLSRLCGLCANHPRDMLLRTKEVDDWLGEVLARSGNLGWGKTEVEVRRLLPSEEALRGVDALLKERGGMLAEARAAASAAEERQTTVDGLQQQLDETTEVAPDPLLAQALSMALPYKSSSAKQKALENALGLAASVASRAMLSLGRTDVDEAILRSMRLPSVARITALQGARQEIVHAIGVARSLSSQSAETVATLRQRIDQFERSHKVVTVADVSQARKDRDEKWGAIKSGTLSLASGSPQLDLALRLADELGDARTISETDSTALQALRDQLETAEEAQGRHEETLATKRRELEEFDAKWSEEAVKLGFENLELDDMPDWLSKRDAALKANDALLEKKHELDQERQAAAEASQALVSALENAGLHAIATSGLGALCSVAEEHIKSQEHVRTVREALKQRLRSEKMALEMARKARAAKDSAVTIWNTSWQDALVSANMTGLTDDLVRVESALETARFIRQRLEKIDTHRSERIQTMQRDLEELNVVTAQLTQALAPDMAKSTASELSRKLNARLDEAKRQAHRKTEAQEFLDRAKRQMAEASSVYKQAESTIEPLLKLAGVADPLDAVTLVDKSLTKNRLEREISDTRKDLEKESDGLTPEDLRAEVAVHPAADAAAQLLALEDQLRDSESKLTELAQAQLTAKQALDAIDGSAVAAIAESQKQEALAEMAEAGEEYIQIATASTLLKWAVDRYRDRKQGPLLQRASEVFRNLTLGSFEKLRVDYEKTPPALLAYRKNNQPVPVSGLSDGTRDQLFLSLRIAALELQTDQGMSVPFVADDLFINFDDKRSRAGLQALYEFSAKAQVLFLSHQEHLLPLIQQMFPQANILLLRTEEDVPV